MAGNNLFVILGMIRAEMREIRTDEDWEKAKRLFSQHASGERVYVPTYKKREHLAKLAELDSECPQKIAKMLGIGVRRVQQLRRLK